MANKEQLKSILVSLGSLAIQVRDCLAESHDQDTYTNLLDELKQSINNVEQITAELAEEMSQVDEGEVYASLSNVRGWQVKLLERVNFIKSFSTNVNVVTKKKPGRLPEVKLAVFKAGASFQIFLGGGRDGLASEASLISMGFPWGVGWGVCKPPLRKLF